MNDVALHPTPDRGAVVREQFRAVGLGLRRELTGAAVLVLGITAILFVSRMRDEWTEPVRMSPDEIGFLLGLIGFVAPLAVWKGETPSNRGYLWSLPLPRDRSTLAKVFGGWAWLMIGIAALMMWVAIQTWLTGGGPGLDEMRFVLPEAVPAPSRDAPVDPALLHQIHWTTPVWMWLVPFVAPTIMYLIGSVAVLRSDYPWLWMAVPFLAFALLAAFTAAANLHLLAEAGEALMVGRYSLETLLTGSNEYALLRKTTEGADIRIWRNLADGGSWFVTVLIWGVPALGAAVLAARRYQER